MLGEGALQDSRGKPGGHGGWSLWQEEQTACAQAGIWVAVSSSELGVQPMAKEGGGATL